MIHSSQGEAPSLIASPAKVARTLSSTKGILFFYFFALSSMLGIIRSASRSCMCSSTGACCARPTSPPRDSLKLHLHRPPHLIAATQLLQLPPQTRRDRKHKQVWRDALSRNYSRRILMPAFIKGRGTSIPADKSSAKRGLKVVVLTVPTDATVSIFIHFNYNCCGC